MASQHLFKMAMEKVNLSARAYDRTLKVSKTIADLSAGAGIKPWHMAGAIRYRRLENADCGD